MMETNYQKQNLLDSTNDLIDSSNESKNIIDTSPIKHKYFHRWFNKIFNNTKGKNIKLAPNGISSYEKDVSKLPKDTKKEEYKWYLSQLIESEYELIKRTIESINISTNPVAIKNLNKRLQVSYRSLYWKIRKIESLTFYDKYKPLTGDTIVSLSSVSKYYSTATLTTKVLEKIDLTINKGDFVVILGPSGSGKTTLMNLISGIDTPTMGNVNVAGFKLETLTERELTAFRKDIIGYVFQRYGLLPNLTVYENILMGSYLGDKTYSQTIYKSNEKFEQSLYNQPVDDIVNKIIDVMGLTQQKEKYPYEMSGGQKQRTSIARAMAKNPLIIFGDEPTAAVDEEMSDNIIDAFVKINKELETTIIMITHDERISQFANKVVFVLDGRINNVVHKEKGEKL